MSKQKLTIAIVGGGIAAIILVIQRKRTVTPATAEPTYAPLVHMPAGPTGGDGGGGATTMTYPPSSVPPTPIKIQGDTDQTPPYVPPIIGLPGTGPSGTMTYEQCSVHPEWCSPAAPGGAVVTVPIPSTTTD